MTCVSGNQKASRDVNIQDQTSPVVIVPMNRVNNITATSNLAALNDTTIDIDVTTGFIDGVFIVITDIAGARFYVGRQIGAPAGNTITLDTPLDFPYESGSQITAGTTQLAVDGTLANPVIFSLRAAEPVPIGLAVAVDVTRLIFSCVTNNAIDLTKFGDIVGGLTNGCVLRRVDGTSNNIFNIKTNEGIAALMYDFDTQSSTNPQQGQDGFIARMTFSGQSKIGVVIRVGIGEDLEFLIQDLLASLGLLSFQITVEGHVVVP